MSTASDLMTPRPVVVQSTDRVRDAVRILQDLDVRHVPVINEQRELVGMVSDRDLRRLSLPVLADDRWLDTTRAALDAPVSTLMTAEPLSVDLEAEASQIAELMLDNKIGAVPVVDADSRLVGIVSYVDLLRDIPFD